MVRVGLFVLVFFSLFQNLAWAKKASKGQSDFGINTNPIQIFNQSEYDDATGVHVKFEELCSDRDIPSCVDGSDPNNPVTITVHDFVYQLSVPAASQIGVGSVMLSVTGAAGTFSPTPNVGPLVCTPAEQGGTPPYNAPCNSTSEPLTACIVDPGYALSESVSGGTYSVTFPFDQTHEGCSAPAPFIGGDGVTLYVELDTAIVTTPPMLTITTGNPSFTISPDQTEKSVTAGNSVSFTISVNPSFGFTDNVTLACPDLTQLKMTCSFNPTQANASTPVTLTVATTGASTTANLMRNPAFPFSLVVPFLLAEVFSQSGVGRQPRRRFVWLTLALISMAALFVACGGGGSNGAMTVPGTPQGKHDITVTGTSSSGAQMTTLTVNVQ